MVSFQAVLNACRRLWMQRREGRARRRFKIRQKFYKDEKGRLKHDKLEEKA